MAPLDGEQVYAKAALQEAEDKELQLALARKAEEQLQRRKEEEDAARRAEQLALLGPLLIPMMEYVVLVMGQTGSGKTTLLNLLGNLDMVFPDGVLTLETASKFATSTIADLSLEHAPEDEMASKTSDAKAYRVKVGHVLLTVIDTPGFGDSRGISTDEEHMKRIIDRLQSVGGVNCVLVTINGREARLSSTLKYVLSMLTSVLPKSVLGHLAVVFTNTESERKLNFKMIELEKIGLPSPPYICLENPLCEVQRASQEENGLNENFLRESQVPIQRALVTVATLIGKIRDFEPVPTNEFLELNERREDIERILGNIYEKYKEEERKVADISHIRDQIVQTGEVKPQRRTDIHWRLVDKGTHFYVCHQEGCHKNCSPAPVSVLSLMYCWMDPAHQCKECGHVIKHHRVAKSHWESEKKVVTVNLGEVEKAKSEKERMSTAIRALEDQIRCSHEEKAKLSAMLFDTLEEYSHLGLPDAYLRLLRMQESCIRQRLEANPGDDTLKDMLSRVEKYIKEMDTSAWREPVKGIRQKLVEFAELVRPPPASWEWRGGNDGDLRQRRIRVPEMDDTIRNLLRLTRDPKHPDGCRGQDGSSMWLGEVKSVEVWRLEHPLLWQQFASTSTAMKQELRARSLYCPPVDPPIPYHESPDAAVNECFLWHGSKASLLPTIREWGLDERVCSLQGLYGAGLYFASQSCKAAQYAPPSQGKHYMLYTRVLLGVPYYPRSGMLGARRPPAHPKCPGKLCDSVIANVGVANHGKQFHREFIIYDRRQAYPEYEVEITC